MQVFAEAGKLSWIPVWPGQRRKICAYNDQEMLVEVDFEEGAVGADHTHPHTQISYALSGEYLYHIEGQEYHLKPGDSVAVESGKVHGLKCLKKGVLLDIFTPVREDFLK